MTQLAKKIRTIKQNFYGNGGKIIAGKCGDLQLIVDDNMEFPNIVRHRVTPFSSNRNQAI